MIKIQNKFLKSILSIIFVTVISLGIIGGCGTIAPEAPFGSEIELLQAPEDISICTTGIQPVLVRAIVIGPEGFPLNDVAVTFDVTFAGDNSLLYDTDGNGIGDSPLLQLVDNDACDGEECINATIEEIVASGALVTNTFTDISDDNGVAEVVILIPGFFNIFDDTGQLLGADPATISVFSGSADQVSEEFGVNNDCDEPEGI